MTKGIPGFRSDQAFLRGHGNKSTLVDLTTPVDLSTLVVSMRIGERLRILREERDIGVAELAEKAGISRQYIYALEAGERGKASFEIVSKLAGALGVTVNEFDGVSETDATDGGDAAA